MAEWMAPGGQVMAKRPSPALLSIYTLCKACLEGDDAPLAALRALHPARCKVGRCGRLRRLFISPGATPGSNSDMEQEYNNQEAARPELHTQYAHTSAPAAKQAQRGPSMHSAAGTAAHQ